MVLLALILTGTRVLAGKLSPLLAVAVWIWGVTSSSMMIALVPSGCYLIYFLLPEAKRRRLGAGLILVIGCVSLIALQTRFDQDTRIDTLLPLLPTPQSSYAILTWSHAWERLNALVLSSPAFPLFLVVSATTLYRQLREDNRTLAFLLLVSVPMLAVFLTGNTVFGALDWDILATTAFPAIVLACYGISQLASTPTTRYAGFLGVLFSLLNTVPWVAGNSTDRSFEIMTRFMTGDPVHYFKTHDQSLRVAAFANRAGRPDISLEVLQAGYERNASNSRVNFNLAGNYFRRGEYDLAETHLRNSLRAEPGYRLAFDLMSNTLQASKGREAADLFRKQYVDRLSDFGKSSYQNQEFKVAADTYLTIKRLGNTTPEVFVNLGLSYAGMNRWVDATSVWKDGLANTPDHPGLLGNLAYGLHMQGKNAEAVSILHKLAALQPNNTAVQEKLRELSTK